MAEDRAESLVRANIKAVHAYQVLLARKSKKTNLDAYKSDLTDAQLQELVKHQADLLATDPAQLAAWVQGKATTFDPAKDIEPISSAKMDLSAELPANVVAAYLATKASATLANRLAVANLYQTCLEIDRDGTVLQQEMAAYIAAGLTVYVGQFGLPGTDADLLEAGRELYHNSCPAPFGVRAADWQIVGRKVWNWGEKNTHIRDGKVIAAELLQEDAIKPLLPKIRAMKPQRIAIVGHSFTMAMHWSTPSSFTAIVEAAFAKENPGVEMRHWGEGGMSAARAKAGHLPKALEWKPDAVFFFFATYGKEDFDAMLQMHKDLTAAGVEHYFFPHNGPKPYQNVEAMQKFAKDNQIPLADFTAVVDNAPEKGKYLSLDGIHMTEPYHRNMARELLKFLATRK